MSKSRSEQAWEAMRDAILSGQLKPGTSLKFADLQKICGMSVSPVREALARLVATGLVTAEHNRGYRVTSLSVTDLEDLVNMRVKLECWALERAIELGDENWEARIISSLHLIERMPRIQEEDRELFNRQWEMRHAEFHDSLISACDSPILLSFCSTLRDQNDRYRRFSLTIERGQRDVENEHRSIAQASIAREAEKAQKLLAEHYRNTASLIRNYLTAPEDANQMTGNR